MLIISLNLLSLFLVQEIRSPKRVPISMSKDPYSSNKLDYDLKIHDGKIFIRPMDDYTNIFLRKSWIDIAKQLFDHTQIEKVDSNFILFK